MIYILEELQTQHFIVDIAELKTLAVLQTSDGLQRPVDNPVHFSVAYSGYDLSANLPGFNYVWLSADRMFVCQIVLSDIY